MPIIDSYAINQFGRNFNNLMIVFFTFTDQFHQDKHLGLQDFEVQHSCSN